MADSLDLNNRDPHGMNNFIQVEFDDVLGEPAGTHSKDCVWTNSYKCFTCGKNNAYKIMSLLCGICAGKFIQSNEYCLRFILINYFYILKALFWGCTFGCLSFKIIWCITPSMRLLNIVLHPIKKILQIILTSKN